MANSCRKSPCSRMDFQRTPAAINIYFFDVLADCISENSLHTCCFLLPASFIFIHPLDSLRKRIKSVKETCEKKKGWIRYLWLNDKATNLIQPMYVNVLLMYGMLIIIRAPDIPSSPLSPLSHIPSSPFSHLSQSGLGSFLALRQDTYEKDVNVYWAQGNLCGKKLKLECIHAHTKYILLGIPYTSKPG